MNNIVRPIFNEKVTKMYNLWVHKQYTNALFTVKKSTNTGLKKKKKKGKNADFSKMWTCDVESKRHHRKLMLLTLSFN